MAHVGTPVAYTVEIGYGCGMFRACTVVYLLHMLLDEPTKLRLFRVRGSIKILFFDLGPICRCAILWIRHNTPPD